MIRKFSLFCNLISIKTSSKSIFSSTMETFVPALEVCPYCGSKGNCVPFAYYDRHLVDFIHGQVCDTHIRVLRVQCSSCQHTHAILPDVIVPYASYSLFFILRVLGEYFMHRLTVEALCFKFAISHSLLYKWLDLFYQNKALWLGVLSNLETSPFTFLLELIKLPLFSSFSKDFFLKFGFSFMQAHAHSPTLYQQ